MYDIGLDNHYYLGFFLNYEGADEISILLISAETDEVQYSIEAPGVGYYNHGTLSTGNEVILNLPNSVEVLSQSDTNKGIYIKSNSDKLTVIGQSLEVHTSESYYALPITKMSNVDHVYYGISVPRTHSRVYSSILIVGTKNNTMMALTVTQSLTVNINDTTFNLIPNREYSFVINRLQTVYVRSLEDLTGTKIVTDAPVSVLSGHECGNVPTSACCCSHMIEQIPPTTLWGKVYYIAPFLTRTSYTIKIVAAYASTVINIYCNNAMESYTINEGEFVNRTSQMTEHCAIYSNKNVLVVQLSHGYEANNYGDPMMTLIPATNQYLNNFDFSNIGYPSNAVYNHFINIIVLKQYYQPSMIYLIAAEVNRSLDMEQWVPIKVNNITEAYATQVNISENTTKVFHIDSTAKVMMIAYGFARFDGYGHIGGINTPRGC